MEKKAILIQEWSNKHFLIKHTEFKEERYNICVVLETLKMQSPFIHLHNRKLTIPQDSDRY